MQSIKNDDKTMEKVIGAWFDVALGELYVFNEVSGDWVKAD